MKLYDKNDKKSLAFQLLFAIDQSNNFIYDQGLDDK